ncbi:MAG: transglutaminase-like domain-containing protein [Planctomycetota bacterium]
MFLPLGWTAFHSEPPETRWTSTGVVRAAKGQTIKQYSFATGELARVVPREPTGPDRTVPRELLPTLLPIAEAWTEGATDDRERLLAIQERLYNEFTYSTDYVRSPDADYLIQFLEDRRGHCEYFASAMAMLGRCVGVPTRVVGGFHVSERNPFGDYAVVRERDAHAWIEAYLPDEGWVTFDPTPPGEITYADAPFLSAVGDWIGDQLHRRGPLGLVIPLGVVLAIVLIRAMLRRRGGEASRSPALDYAATPAILEEFLTKLAEAGFVRAPHEPWEQLRFRLSQVGESEVARLVDRTIHWRYGAASGTELEEELRHWLRAPRWESPESHSSTPSELDSAAS